MDRLGFNSLSNIRGFVKNEKDKIKKKIKFKKSLDSIIDYLIENERLENIDNNNHTNKRPPVIFDKEIEDEFIDSGMEENSIIKGEEDTNIYQDISPDIGGSHQSKNGENHLEQQVEKGTDSINLLKFLDEIERFPLEEKILNIDCEKRNNQREAINQKLLGNVEEDYIFFESTSIENLEETEINHAKKILSKAIASKKSHMVKEILSTPRRKNIDFKKTVKKIANNGGNFTSFIYRNSPTQTNESADLQDILVIGDVSGSMGRYVAIVLYLVSTFEKVANVKSYIFSDSPTYVTPFIKHSKISFKEQFYELKRNASSWEYGTKLYSVLEKIRVDKKYNSDSMVFLITDGGFSLQGEDWGLTVKELLSFKEEINKLIIITPNPGLSEEAEEYSKKLWNVKAFPRHGNDLNSPELQKTARYGLLGEYSDQIFSCQNLDELIEIFENFIVK